MPQILNMAVMAAAVVVALGGYAVLHKIAARRSLDVSFRTALAVFLILFTVEYFIFGPSSFVNMDSEGNLAVVMGHYMARHNGGGQFSHVFGGGQDMYVWFPGMQYFQPEKIFFQFFPVWIALLLHKIMVGALAFAGTYLLARRADPRSALPAVAIAAAVSISHDYLTNYSTSFGTGFAALPLAAYLCVARTREKDYWAGAVLAAIILAAADPIKVFPALPVALVGTAILFHPVRLGRVAGAFALALAAALLNWHEVLYALTQNNDMIGRVFAFDASTGATPLLEAFAKTMLAIVNYWAPAGLMALGAAVLAARGDPYWARAVAALIWMIAAIVVADAFPWDRVGLAPLSRLSHQQYMVMAYGTLAAPVAARALGAWGATGSFAAFGIAVRPTLALLAVVLGMVVWQKAHNLKALLFFGGQSAYERIPALARPDWAPDRDFRTVGFYDTPHVNVVAGFYGFETFDGQLNLNNRHWASYWLAVLRGNTTHGLGTRPGWYWEFWDGSAYAADRHVRFDLLAAANVRYVLSPLPLTSPVLRLLHAAPREMWMKGRPEDMGGLAAFIGQRLRLVFEAGDVFVYELADPAPRVFAATKVEVIEASQDPARFYDRVVAATAGRGIVVAPADAAKLGRVRGFTVGAVGKMANGYDVAVDAPDGGILVVNNTYWPWWTASVDGGEWGKVPIVSANGAHIALPIPKGAREVRVRYHRPMLRDKAAALLR